MSDRMRPPGDWRIVDLAEACIDLAGEGERRMVAIAAPPGAGKSTLAKALVRRLKSEGAAAVLVQMDGFHLDNTVLEARGLLARKGAPETFDAAGFAATLARIRRDDGAEVVLPRFDPRRDMSVAGAVVVTPADRIIVCEGNYLLLQTPPWDSLAPLWDLSVWLEVPDTEIRRRLVQRWLDHGLDPAAAAARAEGNDMANARLIRAASGPAMLTLPGA